ncbi:hypothetical protein F2Q70_00040642 [Brassica cretica]|uniref:Uncharacterized protein n=1 Tax=Brassica cretica TaxID=69181 RepID=A0A8S9KAC5_BRACR|nr:hypothetical protein F2Q70_00040642 [Brassica cretica]
MIEIEWKGTWCRTFKDDSDDNWVQRLSVLLPPSPATDRGRVDSYGSDAGSDLVDGGRSFASESLLPSFSPPKSTIKGTPGI